MDEGLNHLLDLLALLLPTLIFCAAGGGYWLVSRALRPVDQLSQKAEQMSLQNLSFAPSSYAERRCVGAALDLTQQYARPTAGFRQGHLAGFSLMPLMSFAHRSR